MDYASGTDLVFKNTASTPIYLNMYTDGLTVIAEVYGVPLANGVTIDLKVDILTTTKPGDRVTVADKTVPVGTTEKNLRSYGLHAERLSCLLRRQR